MRTSFRTACVTAALALVVGLSGCMSTAEYPSSPPPPPPPPPVVTPLEPSGRAATCSVAPAPVWCRGIAFRDLPTPTARQSGLVLTSAASERQPRTLYEAGQRIREALPAGTDSSVHFIACEPKAGFDPLIAGFIVAARLEGFDQNTLRPLSGDARYNSARDEVGRRRDAWQFWGGVSDWVDGLLFADEGNYRVVLIAVHACAETQTGNAAPTAGWGNEIIETGHIRLPPELRRQTFDTRFEVEALVYQFERRVTGPNRLETVPVGRDTPLARAARDHLRGLQLTRLLGR